MPGPIDTQTAQVMRIADELCEHGSSLTLKHLFVSQGYTAPSLVWAPAERDVMHPLLLAFYQRCQEIADDRGRVQSADLTAGRMDGLTDWLMLVDLDPEDGAMIYGHYGPAIAAQRGRDMTGQSVRAFHNHIGTFFEACYTAVAREKSWLLTSHEPPAEIFARSWRRLIVPLFAPDGETTERFAVLNIGDNELCPGLDIIPDPVFIVDTDLTVRYANTAARRFFGQDVYRGEDMSFFTFTGISLHLRGAPEELAAQHDIRDEVSVGLKGGLVERFLITYSGTRQFGHAYYVVTLRPAFGST